MATLQTFHIFINIKKMKKTNKETLRMQMLAGVITEGQYKKMLNENISDLKVEWTPEYLENKKKDRNFYYEKGLSDTFEIINGEKIKEIVGYFEDEEGDEDQAVIGFISSTTGRDIESYSEDELDDAFMNALKLT